MANEAHEITVKLMGKAAELLARQGACNPKEFTHEIEVSVREPTVRGILQEIAAQNPLIADQIIREDGTPRSSTKILVGGRPPRSLDETLIFADGDEGYVTGPDGQHIPTAKAKKPKPKPKPPKPIVIVIIVPCDG